MIWLPFQLPLLSISNPKRAMLRAVLRKTLLYPTG